MRVSDLRDAGAVATPDLPNGYDEVAARRVEEELVGMGTGFKENQSRAAWLEGALPESKCRSLLLRMKQRIHEDEADLARLMCEAQKLVRGE